MNTIIRTIFAAAMVAASLTAPAKAAPVLPLGQAFSPIVQVEDGCGPGLFRGRDGFCYRQVYRGCAEGWHRGGDGRCYRNEFRDGYQGRVCPPGWHLGPEGYRCWRNY